MIAIWPGEDRKKTVMFYLLKQNKHGGQYGGHSLRDCKQDPRCALHCGPLFQPNIFLLIIVVRNKKIIVFTTTIKNNNNNK